MADNLEIRVEQLTDAIRGLYNKPSLTPAEINDAFNTLLQRFENQTNLSSEKMLQIITNEIKKSAEEKQGTLQEMLYGFEDAIKSAASQVANPKFDMQMSKISTDLNSVYTKMNNQELQLQKFAQTLDAVRTSGTAAEMVKLSNEFAAFSRGFDNITSTLNKNFAEFLTQVQSYSQKEELNQIKFGLEEMIKNSVNLISTGDKIDAVTTRLHNVASREDTNFINEKITILTSFLSDLKAYLEKSDIENKEQARSLILNIEQKLGSINPLAIDEIRTDIKNLFTEIRDTSTYSKDEIITKFADIVDIINKSYSEVSEKLNTETTNVNSSLAILTSEIQRVADTVTTGVSGRTEEIKIQLANLNEDYQNLKNALIGLSSNSNMEDIAKSIIKSNAETIELSHDFIQSQLGKVEEAVQRQEDAQKQNLVNAVELLKNELSAMASKLSSIENEMSSTGTKAFEEPLKKIMDCVETLKSADALKELSGIMGSVTNEINASIASLRDNFEKAQNGSSIAVLQQLNETVPKISDKLEIFRNHVVSENSANITELKQHFAQVVDTITSRVVSITSSIKDDFKDNNGLDSIKVDLQNMSNHIMETVENINFSITKEFNDHKTNIDEMISKINDYEDKFRDKLNSLESTVETVTQENADRLNDTISLNQLQTSETLNSMKTDILDGIMGINKNNKTNFELLDGKLEEIIKKSVVEAHKEKIAPTSLQESNQQELLAEIENKVERCNLQQIHNGKELLSEIQNLNSELSFKIEALNPNANSEIPPSLIRGIDDKVQSILEANADREEYLNLLKSHMDIRMKEVIQKIAKIVSVFKPDAEKEEDAQKVAASVKLDNLLSQLEYLKDNIFAEIKDGFTKLDKREEIISDIYKNVGEVLSNTVYIKNNAPNEFKNAIEEKLESLKNVEFLIEDLKNALQSSQTSTFERINSLNEDVNSMRNGLHDRVNSIVNEITDDIKTSICLKIDTNSGDTSNHIINTINNEVAQRVEALINQASERIASTIIDNVKESLANIENAQGHSADGQDAGYSMADVEADIAKLRLSFEKSSKSLGSDVQNLGGWFKNTNSRLEGLGRLIDALAKKVDNTEKLGLEGITSRLVQSEREYSAPGKLEDALTSVQKKYKVQEMRLEELDEKISLILQKQSEGFDVKSFIDLFYDNTTQTKSLASRVEGIENKLNSISKNIERIISYIDE